MTKFETQLDKGMVNLIETGVKKQNQLDKEMRTIKEVCAMLFDQYDLKFEKIEMSTR